MNHRDAMNTEKTKNWPAADGSLNGHCPERTQTLVFFSTTTLLNPRASRGFFRCAGSHQSSPRIAAPAGRFVPEERRRKLAGGKPAPAGAAPGSHSKRTMPQRGIGEAFGGGHPAASSPPPVASDGAGRRRWSGVPVDFFDAPLGHGATRHRFRGRRPRERTCPRLISSGVPPGRPTCDHALKQEMGEMGVAFQTRSVEASRLCVHLISMGIPTVPTAWLRLLTNY